jgi:hypothetical protein
MNVHQVALDRQDQIHAYMATLDEADLEKFSALYGEEMRASTQSSLDDAARLNANTAAQQIQNITQVTQLGTWISIVVFFIILITIISINK